MPQCWQLLNETYGFSLPLLSCGFEKKILGVYRVNFSAHFVPCSPTRERESLGEGGGAQFNVSTQAAESPPSQTNPIHSGPSL